LLVITITCIAMPVLAEKDLSALGAPYSQKEKGH
jgi:hypothetical protein